MYINELRSILRFAHILNKCDKMNIKLGTMFCCRSFFYREIINFSHLKYKQYCWFEFLFFHAGCIWKYFVLWNVSWWSQIICLINFYQFYGHVVIYMANLLWIFWKTNSNYSLYSIHFLWYHRLHLFLSFSWSLDLFGWRIIEKKTYRNDVRARRIYRAKRSNQMHRSAKRRALTLM